MKKIYLAVLIPCLVLATLASYHQYLIETAPEFEFEVEGYDPRDLLAGHYLQFRIKYKSDTKCDKSHRPASMCLLPQERLILTEKPLECENWISGRCDGAQFRDDLNRYYVPQDRAQELETKLRNGKASVKIAVGKGNAVIKALLIDGRPWKEAAPAQEADH